MSQRDHSLGLFKRDKEKERFYLLPGMGGRAARQKHNRILKWSLLIGLVVSMVFATALYWVNRVGH